MKAIQQTSSEWNEYVPVGCPVVYWPGDRVGAPIKGHTHAPACEGVGRPVVAVVALDRGYGVIPLSHVQVDCMRLVREGLAPSAEEGNRYKALLDDPPGRPSTTEEREAAWDWWRRARPEDQSVTQLQMRMHEHEVPKGYSKALGEELREFPVDPPRVDPRASPPPGLFHSMACDLEYAYGSTTCLCKVHRATPAPTTSNE